MHHYYAAFQSRSHAFLVQQRMQSLRIPCEISYLPREIMRDLCNMGLRFEEKSLELTLELLRQSGIPGWAVYKETVFPRDSVFERIE